MENTALVFCSTKTHALNSSLARNLANQLVTGPSAAGIIIVDAIGKKKPQIPRPHFISTLVVSAGFIQR
jgi:hypothetical protein